MDEISIQAALFATVYIIIAAYLLLSFVASLMTEEKQSWFRQCYRHKQQQSIWCRDQLAKSNRWMACGEEVLEIPAVLRKYPYYSCSKESAGQDLHRDWVDGSDKEAIEEPAYLRKNEVRSGVLPSMVGANLILR